MVTAGVGSKYASTYDASFYWKECPRRLHLIRIKSGFYKVFAWIYFLRREIKTDIAQFSSIIQKLQKPDIITWQLDRWHVAISNLIKKWFISSYNQITLEHVKHKITNHFINTMEL